MALIEVNEVVVFNDENKTANRSSVMMCVKILSSSICVQSVNLHSLFSGDSIL